MDECFNLRKEECMMMDADEIYGGLTGHFCLKFFHGGKFAGTVTRKYVDGHVDIIDMVEAKELTMDMIWKMISFVGKGAYPKEQQLFCHYKVSGKSLDKGLLPLKNDNDVRELCLLTERNKSIVVYVEHGVSLLLASDDIIEVQLRLSSNFENEYVDIGCSEAARKRETVESWLRVSGSQGKTLILLDEDSDDREFEDQTPIHLAEDVEPGIENLVDVDLDVDVEMGEAEVEDDVDYVADEEDNNDELDNHYFEINVDDEVEWYDKASKGKQKVSTVATGVTEVIDWDDMESQDSDGDGDVGECSRKKRKKVRCPEFHRKRDMVKPKFELSQMFGSKKEIKQAIKQHSIDTRRELRLIRNDKTRIRAACYGFVPMDPTLEEEEEICPGIPNERPKCPWTLHASRLRGSTTWKIKTLRDEHWCLKSRNIAACTAKFLASGITETVKRNPGIPVSALKEDLEQKFQVNVSRMKAFRAKMRAHGLVVGAYKDQYAKLRDYCHEVCKTNPGTTMKIEVEPCPNPTMETRVFKRVYCCFGPLKKGFAAGCRPLLGLDGTFLKGPFPGQILSAVGIDSNNGIYPLAYAIVEAENMKSWEWFLDCLGDDINLTSSSHFTFMSDRQKGLIPALAKVFPAAEHRYCLKHIWDNFKTQFKGLAYKDLLWSAATATNVPYFNKAMEELKKMDVKAWEWLKEIPPQHWSKSHFSLFPKCDILYNNLCETFNSKILDARDKPIITCLERIREYIMDRIVTVQSDIGKQHGILCPNIQKLFDKSKEDASMLRAKWNGGSKYQVSGPFGSQCVVDLEARSCTCRRWDVSAIPCKHAIRAIWSHAENGGDGLPENWVDECYKVETWKKIYSFKIEPIIGDAFWDQLVGVNQLLPPHHHIQPGRPRKARRKSQDEIASQRSRAEVETEEDSSKQTRKGGTVRCHKCGNIGHNYRTCKGQGSTQQKSRTSQGNGNGEGSFASGHVYHASQPVEGANNFNNGSTYRRREGDSNSSAIFSIRGGLFSRRALFGNGRATQP